MMNREWSEKIALREWPDQRGIWSPVSWKDHCYDFNVLFDGSIVTSLNSSPTFIYRNACPGEQALGMLLNVMGWPAPEVGAADADSWVRSRRNPDGMHVSRWADCRCPLYIVEHCLPGILVEQRQFAHVPGGGLLQTGNEPMFLWVRFEVTEVIDILNDLERICFTFTPQADNLQMQMGAYNNIPFDYEPYPYPLFLRGEGDSYEQRCDMARMDGAENCCLRIGAAMHGRRNLVGIPAQEGIVAEYLPQELHAEVTWAAMKRGHLMVSFSAAVGSHFDLAIPIVPCEDAPLKPELDLGYARSLQEAESFWGQELATATSVRVPEKLVQGHIDNLPRFVAMISSKHTETGDYGMETATIRYEAIWATPAALDLYALDFLGYGREVEKYLELFRRYQGQEKPPGDYLDKHPGYLGVPPHYESVDWLTDHGAILWAAAWHGLLSLEEAFLETWVPAIIRACEWIRDTRQVSSHNGYTGIMPPAVSTDDGFGSQAVWTDAWNHKGLVTAARLLKRISHERADEFLAEAEDYRRAFQGAYRTVVGNAETWTAPDGTIVPFTPCVLSNPRGDEKIHIAMLDCGAAALVFGELFPADDPIMQATLRWLREGPQHRHFRKLSNFRQVPVLVNEISSAEPGYSWNILHTLELGQRDLFTMGLYSLFAGGASQTAYISCETREGIFGTYFTSAFALTVLRQCMIEEKGEELHLMRMAPKAFFEGEGFDWRNVPTCFGEVSLAGRYDGQKGSLTIICEKPDRPFLARTVLHLPPFENLGTIVLNDDRVRADDCILEM